MKNAFPDRNKTCKFSILEGGLLQWVCSFEGSGFQQVSKAENTQPNFHSLKNQKLLLFGF